MIELYREIRTPRAIYKVEEQETFFINNQEFLSLIKGQIQFDIKFTKLKLKNQSPGSSFAANTTCLVGEVRCSKNDAIVWIKERILKPESKTVSMAIREFLSIVLGMEFYKELEDVIGAEGNLELPATMPTVDLLSRNLSISQIIPNPTISKEISYE